MEQVRTGIVTHRYPQKATVRVKLVGYRDNYVSHELPVIYRATRRNKDYYLPDIGEHVVCLFEGSGLEEGYVLGAIYSTEDRPTAPLSADDGEVYGFEDDSGMSMRFNRARRSAEIEHSSGSRVSMTRDGVVEIRAATVMRVVSSDGRTVTEVDSESGRVVVSGRDKVSTDAPYVETRADELHTQAGRSVTDADSIDETITGGARHNVAGSRSVSVGGNSAHVVAGDSSELVAGESERTVGQGEKTTVVSGDVEIDVMTGSITLKSLQGINLESPLGQIEVAAFLAKITGGTLQVNGVAAPSGQGPFCGLPVCLFTGAAHVGNIVTGT